jgi:hypothetical protein
VHGFTRVAVSGRQLRRSGRRPPPASGRRQVVDSRTGPYHFVAKLPRMIVQMAGQEDGSAKELTIDNFSAKFRDSPSSCPSNTWCMAGSGESFRRHLQVRLGGGIEAKTKVR